MEKLIKRMVMDAVQDSLKDVPYKDGIRSSTIHREIVDEKTGRLHHNRPRVSVSSCNGVDGEAECYWLKVLSRNNAEKIFVTEGFLGDGRAEVLFDENHADNSPIWFMAAILLGLFHRHPDINGGEHPLGSIDYIIENYQTMQTFEENPSLQEKLKHQL